mgnify:CR=1 FL=1
MARSILPEPPDDLKQLSCELQQRLRDAMQADRSDRHTSSERGWNPPPKGYAEDIAETTNEEN